MSLLHQLLTDVHHTWLYITSSPPYHHIPNTPHCKYEYVAVFALSFTLYDVLTMASSGFPLCGETCEKVQFNAQML